MRNVIVFVFTWSILFFFSTSDDYLDLLPIAFVAHFFILGFDYMFFDFLSKEFYFIKRLLIFKDDDANLLFWGINLLVIVALIFWIYGFLNGSQNFEWWTVVTLLMPIFGYFLAKSLDSD